MLVGEFQRRQWKYFGHRVLDGHLDRFLHDNIAFQLGNPDGVRVVIPCRGVATETRADYAFHLGLIR